MALSMEDRPLLPLQMEGMRRSMRVIPFSLSRYTNSCTVDASLRKLSSDVRFVLLLALQSLSFDPWLVTVRFSSHFDTLLDWTVVPRFPGFCCSGLAKKLSSEVKRLLSSGKEPTGGIHDLWSDCQELVFAGRGLWFLGSLDKTLLSLSAGLSSQDVFAVEWLTEWADLLESALSMSFSGSPWWPRDKSFLRHPSRLLGLSWVSSISDTLKPKLSLFWHTFSVLWTDLFSSVALEARSGSDASSHVWKLSVDETDKSVMSACIAACLPVILGLSCSPKDTRTFLALLWKLNLSCLSPLPFKFDDTTAKTPPCNFEGLFDLFDSLNTKWFSLSPVWCLE